MKIAFMTSDHGFSKLETEQFEDDIQRLRVAYRPKSAVTLHTLQSSAYNATSKRVETRITLIATVERAI